MDIEEKLKEINLKLDGLRTSQALFHSCLKAFMGNLNNEELLSLSKTVQYNIEQIQKFVSNKKI